VSHPIANETAVLEPISLENGLHIGSVLVNMYEEVPVGILSIKDHSVKLDKGSHLGKPIEVSIDEECQYSPKVT